MKMIVEDDSGQVDEGLIVSWSFVDCEYVVGESMMIL